MCVDVCQSWTAGVDHQNVLERLASTDLSGRLNKTDLHKHPGSGDLTSYITDAFRQACRGLSQKCCHPVLFSSKIKQLNWATHTRLSEYELSASIFSLFHSSHRSFSSLSLFFHPLFLSFLLSVCVCLASVTEGDGRTMLTFRLLIY